MEPSRRRAVKRFGAGGTGQRIKRPADLNSVSAFGDFAAHLKTSYSLRELMRICLEQD
jgi:hypothetical protein